MGKIQSKYDFCEGCGGFDILLQCLLCNAMGRVGPWHCFTCVFGHEKDHAETDYEALKQADPPGESTPDEN